MRYDNISIRRLPSGRYQYRVRDHAAGRYEAMTFARTDADADREKPGTAAGDAWAKNQLARYRLGQATAEPAAIEAVVGAYLDDVRKRTRKGKPLNPVHIRDVERTLASLVAACPGLDLNKPSASKPIKKWWDELKAVAKSEKGKILRRNLTLAPRTKARYWVHVSSMMTWASDQDIILKAPTKKVKIDTDGDTEPVVFTLAQARAVVGLESVDDPAWRWAVLMLLGGLRRAEALALRWEDILWQQQLIRVVKGKGGSGRLVPLQPDLREILSPIGGPDAKRQRVGSVVGKIASNRKAEWHAFRAVLDHAGIEPDVRTGALSGRMERLHPHTCRHTFAAMMLASGVDSLLLQQYLGHRDGSMTGHYTKLSAMFAAEAKAEKWEAGVLRLLTPRRAAVGGVS